MLQKIQEYKDLEKRFENREARMIVNKSGTTNKTGNGSSTFRATLPALWVREMGLDEETRDIELSYNKETQEITISKKKAL